MIPTTELPVAQLDSYVSGIEKRLADWAVVISTGLDRLAGRITGTAIDRLVRPDVEELLADPELGLAGAGYVAATGVLGPGRNYIAWWQGAQLDRVDALANFSTDTASRYVTAEWFVEAVRTGTIAVTGPYVDLLCTDEYVVTFTHIVGAAAGIVGMDLTVQNLERRALHPLRSVGRNAVLVNSDDRIVVAASPALTSGDIADIAPDAPSWPVGSRFRITFAG